MSVLGLICNSEGYCKKSTSSTNSKSIHGIHKKGSTSSDLSISPVKKHNKNHSIDSKLLGELNITNPIVKKEGLILKARQNSKFQNNSNTGNLSKTNNNTEFKNANKIGLNGIVKLKSSEELRDYSNKIEYNCFKNSIGKPIVEKGKKINYLRTLFK